jgi:hypothetical protein
MTVDPAGRVRKETRQQMTEPDEDPAIATLLEEAAQLATAANEKFETALAIAEQARRDAAFNADRQWFKSRRRIVAIAPASPRIRRSRTCTAAAHGRRGGCLTESCFVWLSSRSIASGPG